MEKLSDKITNGNSFEPEITPPDIKELIELDAIGKGIMTLAGIGIVVTSWFLFWLIVHIYSCFAN